MNGNDVLLPSNATRLERSLSSASDPSGRLWNVIDAISLFNAVPQDGILASLTWEYGLGEIQPFISDPRKLIEEGVAWQRLIGTPEAMRRALSWIKVYPTIEEGISAGKYWASYQIGLGDFSDMARIGDVITLARLSQPVRCKLFRVYNSVFDRRPIVLSEGPALGDGWLSFYSGVSVEGPDGDVIVSFGTKRGFQAEAYLPSLHAASFGTECVSGHTAPYLDRFIVGRSRLSEPLPRNHPFVMGALFSILWADRQTLGRSWRGEWDARRWLDYTGFDRKLPRWRMGRRSLSRSQLVPTESMLADTNSRLGATFAVVIDNPPRLGSFTLSGHDCKRQERRLHEMAIVTQGTETPRLDPPAPQAAGGAWLASCPPIPNPERVRQAGLGETALGLEPLAWSSPETAGTAELSSIGEAVEPPEPSAALVSYQAPLWSGSWAAGRTWNTSPQLSIQ